MKKIFSLLIIFFLFTNGVFSAFGDILFISDKNTSVKSKALESSKNIGILKKGYIVQDTGLSENKWTKVILTDGRRGFILNDSFINNTNSINEIKGNAGEMTYVNLLRRTASGKSNPIGLLLKGTKFQIVHLNYRNYSWIKVKILEGINKNKIGYIKKQYTELYCLDSDSYNIAQMEFKYDIKYNTFCSRLINKNKNSAIIYKKKRATITKSNIDGGLGSLDFLKGIFGNTNEVKNNIDLGVKKTSNKVGINTYDSEKSGLSGRKPKENGKLDDLDFLKDVFGSINDTKDVVDLGKINIGSGTKAMNTENIRLGTSDNNLDFLKLLEGLISK